MKEKISLCFYCENRPGVTIDHIIPRSKKGPNQKWNYVKSCHQCNNAKGDMTYEEFTGMPTLPTQCWSAGFRTTKEFLDYVAREPNAAKIINRQKKFAKRTRTWYEERG